MVTAWVEIKVLNFCLRRKPDVVGVIATGPWLKLAFNPPALQGDIGKNHQPHCTKLYSEFSVDTSALSHDQKVADAYNTDPLVHSKISAKLFVGMYESGLWALDHADEFSVPLLLMHGTADRITSSEAGAEFAKRAGKIVTWRPWTASIMKFIMNPKRRK